MENARIHALSEEIINKIAAGEVVESPASVVKELVENALDAKATRIEVQISNGGKSSILIRDNGCGMSEADLDLCYLPHTTSKLASAEDLFHLTTNGFRGEAVASIAAVSKLSITSREEGADCAHSVHLIGGALESRTEDASPRGTTFLIEDLFFNTPVRKTFLRSDTAEARTVTETVTRLSIAHPDVRFEYRVNGREIFSTGSDGDLRSRVAEALGAGTAKVMLPVDYEEAGIRITGLVVPPNTLENKRNKLFVYVQKRPIWNAVITKAVQRAYEPYGSSGAPVVVLFLEMQDTSVDVNVHPTKREVRFANENDVFTTVHHAIRDAFETSSEETTGPSIHIETLSTKSPLEYSATESTFSPEPTFAVPTKPVLSPVNFSRLPEANEEPSGGAGQTFGLTKNVNEKKPKYRADDPNDIIQDLFSLPENGNIIPLSPQNLRPPTRIDKTPPPQFFQLSNTYLVCEDSEGILIIDQNAAHQRVLYEHALESLESTAALESQELLFPEVIDFSPEEASVIPELLPTLDRLGFHLEPFGKNSYQLRGTPRDLPFSRSEKAIREMLSDILAGENPGNPTHEALARAWAKSNAIQSGDRLSAEEMTRLMASLLTTRDPMNSPSGRATLMRLPTAEIDKRFKR